MLENRITCEAMLNQLSAKVEGITEDLTDDNIRDFIVRCAEGNIIWDKTAKDCFSAFAAIEGIRLLMRRMEARELNEGLTD